ncbi:hypothetical protein TL16_g03090 [Triparma laevis f. inornata]|uniref:Uncharacterized protein n=1 Tax=Triparma laevis f. inornata TaxID=1714386 RepID=A0A9W7DZN9_9STRA|nr:hypothetical protein TL16_g03090 [Triparma laevis f. inornata]
MAKNIANNLNTFLILLNPPTPSFLLSFKTLSIFTFSTTLLPISSHSPKHPFLKISPWSTKTFPFFS